MAKEVGMLGIKRIVMPTDLSDHSLRAVPYAVALAQIFGARLDVIHVHQPEVLGFSEPGKHPLSKPYEQELYAREELDKLMLERVPDWADAVGHVLVGRPAEEIVRYARENNVDVIVIATHGRGMLSRTLIGSTAEEVVRKAPCPVFTVKQPMPVTSPQEGSRIRHRAASS
jgi:nucleotide-binding universal stress UspA family protein